ncbi:hypothetical protein ABBQ32_010991 [Trebouxia sp. C0010 RCD-2024]
MSQVLQHTAFLPTKSRFSPRLPCTPRKAPNAVRSTTPETGRARTKQDVRCCLCQHPEARGVLHQGQHAYLQQQGPNISNLDPALQQQWDLGANAHLGNIVIKPHSNREVWWRCDQCPDGHLHSWSAGVRQRTRGSGCPQCNGRQVCKHNSLATKAPWIAAQWDYEANDAAPEHVVAQSNQKASWHCKVCGHKWKATPNTRVSRHSGCKQCADEARKGKENIKQPTFAECKHYLLAEWDHERNAAQGYFPHKVTLKSAKHIFWLCNKCPAGHEHSWSAQPYSRTRHKQAGCPFCVGQAACKCNSLQMLHPSIAAEWDYLKDQGKPDDYLAASSYLAWWSSPEYGSWQQSINSRTSGIRMKTAWLKRVQERQVSTGRSAMSKLWSGRNMALKNTTCLFYCPC